MTFAPGLRLGRYELLALLGSGSMGEVYRARDLRLGRDVAIKVLLAEFSTHPELLGRFEREARAASALNHPNIVSLFDIGEHEESPYLVTELLEGQTLRERLGRGSLALETSLDIGLQIAKGLAAAHEKGIVHRDLKPENVFVLPDGRIKILDFGLAKLMEGGTSSSVHGGPGQVTTEIGVVLGTVAYMSPEQSRGKPADHRSDLFSFGSLQYEMITGKAAFKRDSTNDTFAAILEEQPAKLAKIGVAAPPQLQKLLDQCFEKDVGKRIQSARDLTAELERLISAPVAPVAFDRRSSSRLWLVILGIAALAVLIYVLVRFTRGPA